jgi:molecular chaperone HscC
VTEAIITVPAYFSDAQRKATRAAGQLAGLKVERLLNEPTAAALAYGIHLRDSETKFLVFDLGGGTFDVSVLDLFENVMEVRASAGDNFLGGEDFVACVIERFFAHNKLSTTYKNNAAFMQRLHAQVTLAKRALSDTASTTIRIRDNDNEYSMELDEATFEKYCAPLLSRLRDPVDRALRDAQLPSCPAASWTISCWPAAPRACQWCGGWWRACSAASRRATSTRTKSWRWARPCRPA